MSSSGKAHRVFLRMSIPRRSTLAHAFTNMGEATTWFTRELSTFLIFWTNDSINRRTRNQFQSRRPGKCGMQTQLVIQSEIGWSVLEKTILMAKQMSVSY